MQCLKAGFPAEQPAVPAEWGTPWKGTRWQTLVSSDWRWCGRCGPKREGRKKRRGWRGQIHSFNCFLLGLLNHNKVRKWKTWFSSDPNLWHWAKGLGFCWDRGGPAIYFSPWARRRLPPSVAWAISISLPSENKKACLERIPPLPTQF